jgi:hypothetical protein
MSNTRIGYMVLFTNNGFEIQEQVLSGPNDAYFSTREKAEEVIKFFEEMKEERKMELKEEERISQKIHKLIKTRSSLLGMANSEEQVVALTKRINFLRNKLR